MMTLYNGRVGTRAAAFGVAAAMAACLVFPALAFADVTVDGKTINQGANEVGGGTATLTEAVLDMVNVKAETMTTDQDLTINFNGGNSIEEVNVADSAEVTMNFSGENEVEDINVNMEQPEDGNANVTINADGHNDFDHVLAYGESNVTINVTGENDLDYIAGHNDANITIKGTDCQKKDILNVEMDMGAQVTTDSGNLTIDHVTVNLKGGERNLIGSRYANVIIDTSKVKGNDDVYTELFAGGTMQVIESVIEIVGDMWSEGLMTIKHSDVKVGEPKDIADVKPYRVFSYTDVKLIDEKNGEVKDGEAYGDKVRYVDTDDNDGQDVDLKADGKPAYYKCKSDDDSDTKGMPKTGDTTAPTFALLAVASAITALTVGRRRRNDLV